MPLGMFVMVRIGIQFTKWIYGGFLGGNQGAINEDQSVGIALEPEPNTTSCFYSEDWRKSGGDQVDISRHLIGKHLGSALLDVCSVVQHGL